ncbi:MAG: M48 family metallopeptidase [Ruminococcaceae bacterium]|nr:M48 family metallopeptidase [Oscillospiraceae bacterium]
MEKEIFLNNTKFLYELQYKKVKNINLRIKQDGKIYVSANKFVPKKVIEDFLMSKAEFIIDAVEKYKNQKPLEKFFTEEEIKNLIISLCEKVYPYFEKRGVKYPQIRFKRMISRWGSCHSTQGVLTFNTNLMYAPYRCVEYVVLHEFAHFLEANHSCKFYDELSKVCPEWKKLRKELNNINIYNQN